MERLIDATRIEQYILNNCSDNEEINTIYAEIINAPTVDPVKHGRWTPVVNGRGGFECSVCHQYAPSYQNGVEWLSNYCPNCGARMDEVEENE